MKKQKTQLITFVAEGFKGGWRKSVWSSGWLCDADDWMCDFDLPEVHTVTPYLFPHVICATPLKVDGYIASFREESALWSNSLPYGGEHQQMEKDKAAKV